MFVATKDESEIFYEISYSNDASLLLTNGDYNYLFTDGRYFEEAKKVAQNCEVLLSSSSLFKAVAKTARLSKIKSIYFDPKNISYADFLELSEFSSARLIPKKGALSKKRAIKTKEEIYKIKTAAELGAKAFDVFAKKILQGGELDEFLLGFIAADTLKNRGRHALSFEPITAIDENAANPHARATDKKLQKGSLLLFDGGLKFESYCSDRTRTACFEDNFSFSKRQKFKDMKLQGIYDTVLAAQEAAIGSAKPGMKAKDLDAVARGVIEKAGFGEFFTHSLGHGVGLDIHEYPYINKKSNEILQEGMTFTIEPGVYIPDHYGVRIEDMVVLTPSGAEVL